MNSKKEIPINSIIAQVDRNSLQVQVNSLQLQPQKQQKQDQKRKVQQGISNIFYYICSCFQTNENDPSPQLEIMQKEVILPPQKKEKLNRKTLVIDLDETLVHSSFTPPENPDIIIPVEIEGITYSVFVLKRPGLDIFLQQMAQIYEIVIFTASLSKYGHPLLDELDKNKLIDQRLFREACVVYEGQYVKDLRLLGRDLSKVIIIDVSFLELQNSPISYLFQPENAIPVKS